MSTHGVRWCVIGHGVCESVGDCLCQGVDTLLISYAARIVAPLEENN